MRSFGINGVLLPDRATVLLLLAVCSLWMCHGTVATKPEAVLLDFLSRPFAPSEWASVECLRDSAIYLKELGRYAPWALQMYDASVKIPPGIITGNYKQLGNYDECLKVKSGHGFVGQACSATVQFEIAEDNGAPREADLGDLLINVAIASNASKWTSGNTVAYEWMWCVPSSCNHSEIQEALEIALDPLKVEGRVDMVVNVGKESCRSAETDLPVFDVSDWIYISILGLFALMIIASTGYDIANQGHLRALNRKDTRHVLLTSFSFYTNGKNLLRTERHRDSIKCLDGLRYISICWIIYGHTHYCEVMGVKLDLTGIPKMHQNWINMLVLNANIVTDTFFLLSGILLAYTEMARKQKESNWRFNVMGIYVHRYIRLTPAYAMMVGFYATLFYKFGTGPHWETWVGSNQQFCRDNWWTNLLYVNNIVRVPSMCMTQSWYLATDMQLVWLSPIFLYPMLKFTQGFFFWLVFALAIFLSVLPPFLITFFLKLTGTMLYYKELELVGDVYQQIYTKVYNRFGPYIIGMALGYILFKTRSRNIRIPSVYVLLGWLMTIVVGSLVIFGPRAMYMQQFPYDRIQASFYAGFHRQCFALAVSWIIFCSVHGYAGLIGHFLSWRGWVPLAKLTYSAYLCHFLFLLADLGSVRTTTLLSNMAIVRSFFANLCLTMILSVLWALCFEMPFMTLDRLLISRKFQPGLSAKTKQGNMLGSIDSGRVIYRSTEETLSTTSRSYNDVLQRKSSKDSVYNSAGNISYHEEIDAKADPRTEEDSRGKSAEGEPYSVYVIGQVERNDDSIWSKLSPRKNRDSDQDFDEDPNEASRITGKKEFDCRYGSLGNEEQVRTKKSAKEQLKIDVEGRSDDVTCS